MEGGKRERKLHIDLLRIVACISVLMLHSASQYWYEAPTTGATWLICNAYDAVSRFGVPVFVMISGMLFLSKEGEIRIASLYRNNILRLTLAYVLWSVIYGLWDCREWMGAEGVTLRDYAAELILGRYHLWFLPMMIGIYMLLPLLKRLVESCDKKLLEYFLILFFVLQIGRGTLAIVEIPTLAKVIVELLDVELVCSYVGYFVLGYYLERYPLSGNRKRFVCVMAPVSALLAVAVSSGVSIWYGEPRAEAFDSYSVFTFLISVALFVFFREKVSRINWNKTARGLIKELSANTFGVYLLHLLMMEFLQVHGIDSMHWLFMPIPNMIAIPMLVLICYLACNVVISVARRIPFVGKCL